jgi:hypothetical protein
MARRSGSACRLLGRSMPFSHPSTTFGRSRASRFCWVRRWGRCQSANERNAAHACRHRRDPPCDLLALEVNARSRVRAALLMSELALAQGAAAGRVHEPALRHLHREPAEGAAPAACARRVTRRRAVAALHAPVVRHQPPGRRAPARQHLRCAASLRRVSIRVPACARSALEHGPGRAEGAGRRAFRCVLHACRCVSAVSLVAIPRSSARAPGRRRRLHRPHRARRAALSHPQGRGRAEGRPSEDARVWWHRYAAFCCAVRASWRWRRRQRRHSLHFRHAEPADA